MTIGENIQYYRKKSGMSQETLGQKLLVSRQTVSLWENDQTVPTIDNLIRLKGIFGVSVDRILDCDGDAKEDVIIPAETYQFNYSYEELSEIYKIFRKGLIKRFIIFAAIFLFLMTFILWSSAPDIIIGTIIGTLFMGGFLHIKGLVAYKKTWEKSKDIMVNSCYEYQVYNEYIRITIKRNKETVHTLKVYFKEIDQVQDSGKYIFLIISGRIYILRKADLSENSNFHSFMKNISDKKDLNKTSIFQKSLSMLLVVGSIFSIVAALLLISNVSNSNHLFTENTWLFFLFVPIPVLSIIFGLILKSKGYKYKKNVIVGIVMTLLLCIYGSFSFIFSAFYSHSDEPINRMERYLDVDIPEYEQINTIDMTDGNQSGSSEYIYYTSDVYFDDNMGNSFENLVANDERWISSVPNDLIGIASGFNYSSVSDFSLFYNIDNDEYNTVPEESGRYHYISVFYLTESNQMKIVEYELDYVK